MSRYFETQVDEAASKIWIGYQAKCELAFKTRNGTIACGVSDPLELDDIYARPEFIDQHEGRAAYLLMMLLDWYPVTMTESQQLRQIKWLLMHDGGERRIGDQLDDGSNPHDDLRKLERMTMMELIDCFPESRRPELKINYETFELYAEPMALAKAVDKAEAVLWQLFLYTKGHEGDVWLKNPPARRDVRFADILGTHKPIDIWCLHYRVVTRNLQNVDGIDSLNEVLAEAFMDVYGDIPLCMTIDVEDIVL